MSQMSQCHKCHNVTMSQMSPEGGLVSCGVSQQCHTLWQEDDFDGLTPAAAFGSGDHHHYDNEEGDDEDDDEDDNDIDEYDNDDHVDTLMVWNLTSMLFWSLLKVELSLAAHNSFSLRQTNRTVEFS